MDKYRAVRARMVVERFAFVASLHPKEPATVRHLIIDLGHFCENLGIDFLKVIGEALAIDRLDRSGAPDDAPFPEVTITINERKH
ncbi:MAG: hypothetical protein AB7E81_04585 [Hyphomicrobiaceae bacterium]|jgi:hypothetical protein